MIPTRATDEQHAEYVANIKTVWNAATAAQVATGRAWYPMAHRLADMLAEGNVAAGAGVIAALSANKSWPENQRLAHRSFDTGTATGHVANALGKAQRIMEGEAPESVLPMAAKTGNFYRCIVDPTDPDAVVIDRHAHDVAVNEIYGNSDRGLSNPNRYATVAHAYREAARQLGELPQVVQAVTWTVMVESKGH